MSCFILPLPYVGHVINADAMRLTLTDGPQNAQAILVDPTSLDLYIFPKSDCSELYRVPYAQSLTQATPMSRLLFPFDKVTSAEIATSNKEILVRTYTQLFYYTRQPGGAVVTALKRTPKRPYLIKCSEREMRLSLKPSGRIGCLGSCNSRRNAPPLDPLDPTLRVPFPLCHRLGLDEAERSFYPLNEYGGLPLTAGHSA